MNEPLMKLDFTSDLRQAMSCHLPGKGIVISSDEGFLPKNIMHILQCEYPAS